jgi:predicted RecB family nuclease
MITSDTFKAFLHCKTKSHLHFQGVEGSDTEIRNWQHRQSDEYERKGVEHLRASLPREEWIDDVTWEEARDHKGWRYAFKCSVQSENVQSSLHGVERIAPTGKGRRSTFIPIRLIPHEKITKVDRLLLAFDAQVLAEVTGRTPSFGRIIHGLEWKATKVTTGSLMATVRSAIRGLSSQQAQAEPLELVLNRHCSECEYRACCRQRAMERDDLSLLSNMSEAERKKCHGKGIFTVNQLSYTYRARRRAKKFVNRPEKYSQSLRALSLREARVHVVGKPTLPMDGTPVFLDVEGVPDRDFYYLIGLHYGKDSSKVRHHFWAESKLDEEQIFLAFLAALNEIENPQLIHYGQFEIIFLKQMEKRYPESIRDKLKFERLLSHAVNLVSTIYAHIYFPTYSNSLKEIGGYLGYQRSIPDVTGYNALIWRYAYEESSDVELKERLIRYNAEDCDALETVFRTIVGLCQERDLTQKPEDRISIHTDDLLREYPHHYGKVNFVIPEMEIINEAAYWHHQRDKVYFRSRLLPQRSKQSRQQKVEKKPEVNQIVYWNPPPPAQCDKCKGRTVYRYGREYKGVYDIKFTAKGVKRWITLYIFHRFFCYDCGVSFYDSDRPWTRSQIGPNLQAYILYLLIELCITQRGAVEHINQLFGYSFRISLVANQKRRAAQFYQTVYDVIIRKLTGGSLIHADETRISIQKQDGYVWTLTSLDNVIYFYTSTRESDKIKELLKDFKGVLVSDFYGGYDAIDCPQQKYLIHLIRDLNDDLRKQPFNNEMQEIARNFTFLLKPIIETVDRFGLKTRFLKKHRISTKRFFDDISKRHYTTDAAIGWKQRLERNHHRLFTFLDYDGVPWNNNNAEHAIKAFARLRKGIDGFSSEKGIQEYLILMSIYETCRFQEVEFLDFLLSRKGDIDEYARGKPKRRSNPVHDEEVNVEA